MVSAACVNKGPLGYLSVTVNADPADARTDQIPGDVTLGGRIAPGWGLHLADMNLAMGNLVALIEAQAPRGGKYLRRKKHSARPAVAKEACRAESGAGRAA